MRAYSWNVNGLRALHRKELLPWKLLRGADVICLQETKAHPEQLPDELTEPKGWRSYWSSAARRGYSGTAIFSRHEPDEVLVGLGAKKFDREGRVVAVRFGDLLVTSAYFPNSQEGGARLEYKLSFCRAMQRHLARQLEKGYETLLVGDFNIAHEPIDLARPKQNEGNAGYLPEERAWMSRFLRAGFHDMFRERNPTKTGAYTWWSFRAGARARNIGWRLDYACVSTGLVDRVKDVRIHPDVAGSDHCPVSIEL